SSTPFAPRRVRWNSCELGGSPSGRKTGSVPWARTTPAMATARQPSSVGGDPAGREAGRLLRDGPEAVRGLNRHEGSQTTAEVGVWYPADQLTELRYIGLKVPALYRAHLRRVRFDHQRLAAKFPDHVEHFLHRDGDARRHVHSGPPCRGCVQGGDDCA